MQLDGYRVGGVAVPPYQTVSFPPLLSSLISLTTSTEPIRHRHNLKLHLRHRHRRDSLPTGCLRRRRLLLGSVPRHLNVGLVSQPAQTRQLEGQPREHARARIDQFLGR